MFSSVLFCACCIGYGTTAVYGAEDGGSAAQDDSMALLQSAIRATDVDAPKSATNLSKTGSRWFGWEVVIEEENGVATGYPKIDGPHKKCFLSKASLFSAANCGFKFKSSPRYLQKNVLEDLNACKTCQVALQKTLDERKTDLADGTQNQKACSECYDAWNQLSGKSELSQADKDYVFQEQQPYMNDLAESLKERGVSLYLDFKDKTAEAVIGDYRTNGLRWPPEVILGVTEQLRRSVERTDVFLHWEGAGGEYCMIEKAAAAVVGLPIRTFRFPPISDKDALLQAANPKPGIISPEICRRDKYDKSAFAVRLCEMCGGYDCTTFC